VFVSFVRLVLNYVLNHGIKKSDLTKVFLQLDESKGTYALGVDAVITIETKKVLTPRETRRKRLLILFLISLIFMFGLQTIGGVLPDVDAGLGRILILVSEIPAFVFSLASTRFFVKTRSRRKPSKVAT
jgi:hypothetical protein